MEQYKLLIVEDSRPISTLVEYVAKEAGYQSVIVETLAECKQVLAQEDNFYLASVDYSLPDGPDGEAIDEVIKKGIPAIVMTGHLDSEIRDHILSKAVSDYIPKESSEAFAYLAKQFHRFKHNPNFKVLVVDDSASTRSYVRNLLERNLYEVIEAENGQQGLALLAANPDTQLIITDYEMPVMNGVRFVSEVRKTYAKESVCIIGLSGGGATSLSARFIHNGANDFLQKPFCLEEFYCRIYQSIEHLEHMAKLKQLADVDSMTGLYNRYAFFNKANQLGGKIESSQYAVAMIDIDHFKKINDEFGHDMGDEVIQNLALSLQQEFDREILCRMGGEEFVVWFIDGSAQSHCHLLDAFRERVGEQLVRCGNYETHYSISIGYACAPDNIEQVIQYADQALYQSKTQGRNQLTLYSTQGV
ncbi:response regulator/GGDEF domain-containing protein [Catenovulum agarivorans DS-2]|uniref:diguanylate cyclase n=1 Tax=Catenovulum agarivorans DS-2 TaxID=1328313 RepID=W7Q816_9ALTE|nr:diguanylate cyclase [Catenovulum agarivorans]EWH08944.1 response regulator/GGDEF domain-containing protein [Catenovulum agarivorans DS-2]